VSDCSFIENHSGPLRLFGVANIVFVATGVVALTFQIWASNLFQAELVGKGSSVIWGANRVGQIAAGLFLVLLAYASARLLQRKADAIRVTSVILAAELAYIAVAGLFLCLSLGSLELTLKGAIIFNLGIAPQILTGYPVIGLILLNRLVRRRGRVARP
jgi:hypothetical protein